MKCYCINEFLAPIQQKNIEIPLPTARQVLLKIKASGLCHSDVHLWEGYYDVGNNKRLELKDRGIKLPITPGHEIVGKVVSKGQDVDSNIIIGSNYIVYPWMGCGKCENCILLKQDNYCTNPKYLGIQKSGGFAEYVLVPDYKYLINIRDSDPAIMAQYACSGLTTYSAINKIDKKIYNNRIVIIFGAGGLGLMAISILKAIGAFGCIVVTKDKNKQKAALEAGALSVFNLEDDDLEEKLLSYNNGKKYHAIIDLIGNTRTTNISFNVIEKFGSLVIVGMFGGLSNWPLALIPMKAIKIIGSYVGSLKEFKELMSLALNEKIKHTHIKKYYFSEINKAILDLKNGNIIGRAVIVSNDD